MILASRASDQFAMRLPHGMRDRIKNEAARNGRSMNSEIVFHLNRIYGDDGAVTKEKAEAHCNA